MTAPTRLVTAEELSRLPDDGRWYELIAGELRALAPTGDEHGGIVMAVAEALNAHVRTNRLGRARTGEPGYVLERDPDTVRAADVAFISAERARATGTVAGYRAGAPDLAIEVISPNDLYTEVEEKVAEWLAHGTRMVVVVNPRRRTAAVYRAPTVVRILTEADTLDGEEVVPGWRMPVATMFENEDDL